MTDKLLERLGKAILAASPHYLSATMVARLGDSPEAIGRAAAAELAQALGGTEPRSGRPLVRDAIVGISARAIWGALNEGKRGWLVLNPQTGEMAMAAAYPGARKGFVIFDLREFALGKWHDAKGRPDLETITNTLKGAAR